MISANARNLRALHVETSFKENLMIGLCEELKALAGNQVLWVLSISVDMDICESKALIEDVFRRLEEVLMDPGWSTLVQVWVDIKVVRWDFLRPVTVGPDLELDLVPGAYLGRLSSRGILHYQWKDWSKPIF